MKTSELIAILKEVDPAGDTEVVIDGECIIAVNRLPAYYDGAYQKLNRDSNGKFSSASIERSGFKVEFDHISIEDAMWNNEDLDVDCEPAYASIVNDWRKNVQDAKDESSYTLFRSYVLRKAKIVAVEIQDRYESQIRDFYFSNLSYRDKIPKDILDLQVNDARYGNFKPSIADMKMLYWANIIRVNFDDRTGLLEIINTLKTT